MIHIPVALKNYHIFIDLYIDDHRNSTGDFSPIFEKWPYIFKLLPFLNEWSYRNELGGML